MEERFTFPHNLLLLTFPIILCSFSNHVTPHPPPLSIDPIKVSWLTTPPLPMYPRTDPVTPQPPRYHPLFPPSTPSPPHHWTFGRRRTADHSPNSAIMEALESCPVRSSARWRPANSNRTRLRWCCRRRGWWDTIMVMRWWRWGGGGYSGGDMQCLVTRGGYRIYSRGGRPVMNWCLNAIELCHILNGGNLSVPGVGIRPSAWWHPLDPRLVTVVGICDVGELLGWLVTREWMTVMVGDSDGWWKVVTGNKGNNFRWHWKGKMVTRARVTEW